MTRDAGDDGGENRSTGSQAHRLSAIASRLLAQQLGAALSPLRRHVPNLPVEVEQVILTALTKDLKERFATIQALASRFRKLNETCIN
jgi:hypothetical protein